MNSIDRLSFTKTIQQVVFYYKKHNMNLQEDMKTCSRGNREEIEDLLGKKVVENTYLEREELIYKDILESE